MTNHDPNWGGVRPGSGQKSFKEKHGEAYKRMNVQLGLSQHAYVTDRKARGMSASEYIRRLIEADMEKNSGDT